MLLRALHFYPDRHQYGIAATRRASILSRRQRHRPATAEELARVGDRALSPAWDVPDLRL
jgi:hypothetical protein